MLDGKLITCSVDQRLHLWSKATDSDDWAVAATKYMDVADIACISHHRYFYTYNIYYNTLFLVECFACTPDSFELVYWGT